MEAATANLLQAAAPMGSGESSQLRESITSYLALNGKIRWKSTIPRENNLAPKSMGGSIVAHLSQDRWTVQHGVAWQRPVGMA